MFSVFYTIQFMGWFILASRKFRASRIRLENKSCCGNRFQPRCQSQVRLKWAAMISVPAMSFDRSCPLDTPKWWPATAVPKELVIRCDFPHHWCAHGQKWRNLCTWMMMSLLQPQHSLAHLRISRTFSRFNDANNEHAFPTHGYAW